LNELKFITKKMLTLYLLWWNRRRQRTLQLQLCFIFRRNQGFFLQNKTTHSHYCTRSGKCTLKTDIARSPITSLSFQPLSQL